jgi:hypothetical protein
MIKLAVLFKDDSNLAKIAWCDRLSKARSQRRAKHFAIISFKKRSRGTKIFPVSHRDFGMITPGQLP